MNIMQEQNQIHPEFLGSINSLNPFVANNSGSRSNMDAAHISQMLVLPKGTPKRVSSGVEFEYGKYTFQIKVDEDCTVLRKIAKYPTKGIGVMEFNKNPEITLVVEYKKSKEVDVIVVDCFHCNHKFGGFRYVPTDTLLNIKEGEWLLGGTVLAHSPIVKDNGDYCFGIEANVVMGSFPWVIDDGIAVSESFCRKAQSVGFGDRSVEWGVDWIPLNLYGNEKEYKPFPDIGDRIREDGIVFALRRVTPYLGPVEMSPLSLMEPDFTFDELTYGYPNALVEDVDVYHSYIPEMHRTPSGMETQAHRYFTATQAYESKLIKCYRELKRKRGGRVNLTPRGHNVIMRAMYNDESEVPKGAKRTIKKRALNDWRVTVKYSYPIIPNVAHKMSDLHAGKGVITKIIKDEDRPMDKHGRYADVILDSESTIHRMNPGRIFEQYFNATSDQVLRNLEDNFTKDDYIGKFDYLREYFSDISPEMSKVVETTYSKFLESNPSPKEEAQWVKQQVDRIVKDNIRLWVPTYTPELGTKLIKLLHEKYPIDIGPITFRGMDGKMKTSKDNILIASMYFIMLEKIANSGGATATPKRQHHGIISKLSDSDKYSRNYRDQPIRIFGETETRIVASMMGGGILATVLNWANSPAMCIDSVRGILNAAKPTDIKMMMDYVKHAKTESRALQYVKHILQCFGMEFDYIDETQYQELERLNGSYFRTFPNGHIEEVNL